MVLFLCAALLCSVLGTGRVCAETVVEQTHTEIMWDSPEKTASYLKQYFDVELPEKADAAAFNEALKSIAGEEAPQVEEWSALAAITAAVKAAGFEELALTYSEDKARERLELYGVDPLGEGLNMLACALDAKLVTTQLAVNAVNNEEPEEAEVNTLLMQVADALGKGRNFLGYSTDADIFGKLEKAWNSFVLFDDPDLSTIGKIAVEEKITTGYGLKYEPYDARFLPELTLQYGHSDIRHALQLAALLNSENIPARIQLEPKISIYQYLLEWGPVPEATPTYEVKKFSDDLYLVYAVEYDLKLEFASKEELLDFDRVILEFAKKDAEDEEGLIYGSWWQPLYSSTIEDLPEESYKLIYDCVMKNGLYSIHPFTLPELKDEVAAKLESITEDIPVELEARYANTAFYHYLSGEDSQ